MTLRPVFDGRDRHELLRQIAVEEPQPPRAVDPAIPVELETILLKAVAKEPTDRYATAQELADDLERFLKDEPVRARRPTLLQRARKWSLRHRAIVWTCLLHWDHRVGAGRQRGTGHDPHRRAGRQRRLPRIARGDLARDR